MANYLEFEARKISYRQTKDGVVVSFLINPHDVPDELATAELQTIYVLRAQQTESGAWIEEQASGTDASAYARGVSDFTAAPQSGEELRQPSKPHRDWSSLPLSEQCAMTCNKSEFRQFLRDRYPDVVALIGNNVPEIVRVMCCVQSRKELDSHQPSAERWQNLAAQYSTWLTTKSHAETYR